MKFPYEYLHVCPYAKRTFAHRARVSTLHTMLIPNEQSCERLPVPKLTTYIQPLQEHVDPELARATLRDDVCDRDTSYFWLVHTEP